MRITSKGQVTIPQPIRESLGLLPDSDVEFVKSGSRVYLQKTKKNNTRGKRLIAHMRGRMTVRMSTDQILKLTRG